MHIIIRDKKEQIFSSNREVQLSASEETVSRTDIYGNILYYNHTFSKISGYGTKELIRRPYSILRHPDMPKAIFYFIWQTLLAGNSTHALIKNFTKDGNYYWQLIKFKVQKDNQNNTISFLSQGRQAPKQAIKDIEPLYKKLLENEKKYNIDSSIKALLAFLNSNNMATYNDYICRVCKERRCSLFSSFTM
ncbi:Methyl-accepting chemotaxis protein [hydrothermal vent metagenome]|uniref:Methyl-accepting chemotaxis protein n=1 Tax=hydrothermal vent metagenome TaxID=652676 RepID=A0A1W1CCM7_9ZZZZ